MTSVSEQGREVQMQPHDALSGDCPSWCVDTGSCRGDHIGKAFGTTATGGLPPYVDGPEAPRHNIVIVRAQYAASDDLPPGVALFGVNRDQDFQVDLTLREAGILLAGLQDAIDAAKSD